jgi:hypothetical protein
LLGAARCCSSSAAGEDEGADNAARSGGGSGHCRSRKQSLLRTFEVAGEALRSIRQVAANEWKSGRALDQNELDRSTAVLNERLVRVMFRQSQPDYTIVDVRAFPGAQRGGILVSPWLPPRLTVHCAPQTWCTWSLSRTPWLTQRLTT